MSSAPAAQPRGEGRTVEARLGRLEVPVGELPPEEVVERPPSLPKVVLLVAVGDAVHLLVHFRHDPALCEGQLGEARRVAEGGIGEGAALGGVELLEVQEDELAWEWGGRAQLR